MKFINEEDDFEMPQQRNVAEDVLFFSVCGIMLVFMVTFILIFG